MTGISTASLYNVLAGNSNDIQSAWAVSNEQESSGLVSTTYGGLGAVSGRVLNFQSDYIQNSAWTQNATTGGNKTQLMYSSLTSLINSLTSFRTGLSGLISTTATNPSTATSLQSQTSSALNEAANVLNQTYAGSYLFAGTATDTKPVDVSNYPASGATLSATSLDTAYYQGNSVKASIQVSSTDTVTFGVLGNDTSIAQAFTALGMASQAANTAVTSSVAPNATTLKSAYDLLDTAIQGIANLQAQVGDSSARMKAASETTSTYATYLQGVSSDLTNVNVAQAAAQTSAFQTMLTASYKALADGLSVSLVSYLH